MRRARGQLRGEGGRHPPVCPSDPTLVGGLSTPQPRPMTPEVASLVCAGLIADATVQNRRILGFVYFFKKAEVYWTAHQSVNSRKVSLFSDCWFKNRWESLKPESPLPEEGDLTVCSVTEDRPSNVGSRCGPAPGMSWCVCSAGLRALPQRHGADAQDARPGSGAHCLSCRCQGSQVPLLLVL